MPLILAVGVAVTGAALLRLVLAEQVVELKLHLARVDGVLGLGSSGHC